MGEELLIIQKEFDGFDDTRERLDLLAVDEQGNLVVVENKLDDSGKDVVWQALKYASYCSSLSKQQVVEIYQHYLNRYEGGGDASGNIVEFLEAADIDEVVLNNGNRQRIMFVAASFRKEVTSTALWLLSHGIELQCIKATPYEMGEQLFLNIEQIIPTPEAKELMIGMSAKEAEQKQTEVVQRRSYKLRLAFWEQILEQFKQSDCRLFDNISPSKDHWLSAGSGVSACPLNLIFNAKEVRVELWIAKATKEENKAIFDQLYANKDSIETTFGQPLEWMRLDDKKSCRICLRKAFDGFDEEEWPSMNLWLIDHMYKLEKAVREPLQQVAANLKR